MAAIIYKCPNCGGDLRFEPQGQTFRCEYCLSEFSKEQMEGSVSEQTEAAVNVYSCPSCGAEVVADETTAASFCYYCHNPVVLAGRLEGEYHPDGVLPFGISRQQAFEIFEKWIGGKKYIPKEFYSQDQIEKLTGVYFPYWLYGCEVAGKLEAQGKKQKSWVEGNIRFTRTEEYAVSRDGIMKIKDVSRNALSKANRKLAEGVMPFETEKLQPFEMAYLSGFLAENRDMEKARLEEEIKAEVCRFAGDSLRSELSGYDTVQIHSEDMQIKDPQWQYVLMPVWTLTYVDRKTDKVYYFACNGQTGKVCGELPVDSRRLFGLFLSVFVPVFAVLLAVGWFL